jgi:MtrB/PioB family decaheme-associated outer membrane protein
MSASTPPMQFALLVAALAQVLPSMAYAAKADKDADEARICEDCPDTSGRSGWVEGGVVMQSDDSFHFGRYTGNEANGALLNLNGEVSYRGKLDGAYLNGKVMNLGLESRSLSLEGGRQGKYGVGVEYDRIPNFLKDYPGVSLKTERDRLGVRFSLLPVRDWEVTGHFRRERKDGTRDVGAAFGFGNPAILAVPVDYQTDDFGLALGYQGERLQARFAYAGSLFKNDLNAITWPNPSPGPATGRIAESPDNQSHQISAQFGYQVTHLTRVGASFARGRMTQDQAFLPYGTGPSPVLPANSLDGEVNTTLAKVDVNSRPIPKLRLDASYTYSDRDNNTPVNTYNYVIADTVLATDPVTGLPVLRQNRPYGFEQHLLRLKAGYRLPKNADLSGGFDIDKLKRSYRQAEETEDQTLWAKLKLQPMEGVETTLKISHSDRDASAYDPTAYQNPVYPESGAIPGDPLMKAFEMADRARDKIGFDVAYTAGENLSLGLGFDYYKDDYRKMVLGLTEASGLTATPSLTYAFNDKLSASAYYTYERLKSEQSGREWITAPPISVPWAEADTNETQTVGLSVNWKAIPKKLDIGADVVYSDFSGKIKYPNSTDLPELSSSLTAIGVHGTYAMKENLSFRVGYRYENYRESDWANVPLLTVTTLGVTPDKQETHVVYLSIRYEFK